MNDSHEITLQEAPFIMENELEHFYNYVNNLNISQKKKRKMKKDAENKFWLDIRKKFSIIY